MESSGRGPSPFPILEPVSRPPHAPVVQEVLRRRDLSVSHVRCSAGPGDAPFPERHSRSSIALARSDEVEPRADASPRARDRVADALSFIEARCADELSLEDVAACAGLSPFHFLRLFRSHVGRTPHQYLIRARIGRAIELLRET